METITTVKNRARLLRFAFKADRETLIQIGWNIYDTHKRLPKLLYQPETQSE